MNGAFFGAAASLACALKLNKLGAASTLFSAMKKMELPGAHSCAVKIGFIAASVLVLQGNATEIAKKMALSLDSLVAQSKKIEGMLLPFSMDSFFTVFTIFLGYVVNEV